MAKINIIKDRCKSCQLCIAFCPKGLLKKSNKLNKLGVYPVIFTGEEDSCIGCSFCAIMCPDCCIEIFKTK
jgi:2-oxoglutarate ferredoxin oxidoreductase subunit delta